MGFLFLSFGVAMAFAKNNDLLRRESQVLLEPGHPSSVIVTNNSNRHKQHVERAAAWAERLETQQQKREKKARLKQCTHIKLTCPEIPPQPGVKKKPTPGFKLSDVIIRRESPTWTELLQRYWGEENTNKMGAVNDGVGTVDGTAGVVGESAKMNVVEGIEACTQAGEAAAEGAGATPIVGPIITASMMVFKFLANQLKDRVQGCGTIKFEFCKPDKFFGSDVNYAMRASPFFPHGQALSMETTLYFDILANRVTGDDLEKYILFDGQNGTGAAPRDELRAQLAGIHAFHYQKGKSCSDLYKEAKKPPLPDSTLARCKVLEEKVKLDHEAYLVWVKARARAFTGTYSAELLQGYHGCKSWTTMNEFEDIWRQACYKHLCGLQQSYGSLPADATKLNTWLRKVPGQDLRCTAPPPVPTPSPTKKKPGKKS
jgi:hypothetical protein